MPEEMFFKVLYAIQPCLFVVIVNLLVFFRQKVDNYAAWNCCGTITNSLHR